MGGWESILTSGQWRESQSGSRNHSHESESNEPTRPGGNESKGVKLGLELSRAARPTEYRSFGPKGTSHTGNTW